LESKQLNLGVRINSREFPGGSGPRGVEFVVDCGPYVGPIVGSTVIDMSTGDINIIRVGKGDAKLFE
jgi:hypothetical protein